MICDGWDNGRCLGTKEIDSCSCEGNKLKCDFYPSVREAARLEENDMITAAEANAQAKESIDIDFEDRLEEVMNDIKWASLKGRMKIQAYMPSLAMREKVAKYLEKLGYLISVPNNDDSLRYENNGCYMYIYWG